MFLASLKRNLTHLTELQRLTDIQINVQTDRQTHSLHGALEHVYDGNFKLCLHVCAFPGCQAELVDIHAIDINI